MSEKFKYNIGDEVCSYVRPDVGMATKLRYKTGQVVRIGDIVNISSDNEEHKVRDTTHSICQGLYLTGMAYAVHIVEVSFVSRAKDPVTSTKPAQYPCGAKPERGDLVCDIFPYRPVGSPCKPDEMFVVSELLPSGKLKVFSSNVEFDPAHLLLLERLAS